MLTRTLATLLLLLPGTASALDQKAPPTLAQLAGDVLRSLALARDARVALNEGREGSKAVEETTLADMVACRKAIARMHEAASLLEPYTLSKNQTFSRIATNTRLLYQELAETFEGVLRIQETLVDLKPGQPLGPVMSEASKYMAAADDAWKLLPIASAASLANAMVDPGKVTREGKVGFLLLTKAEREALLEQIKTTFGSVAASGQGVGLHPPEASAALLAKFLLQSWRDADTP